MISMTHPRRRAILAAALLGFTASSSFAGTIRADRDDQLYLDLVHSAPAYAAVGQFLGSGADAGGAYNFAASGTLIAGNWVLTAAHVVDGATSLSFNLGSTSFTADQWIANPNWNGNLSSGYDLALVHFSTDLSLATGINAASLYTGKNELGQVATIVGYGATGTGDSGYLDVNSLGDLVARAGNNVVDATLNTPGRTDRILLTDFDNPTSAADNSFGSATPLDLEYMIAPGDSGGGLFININGADFLAGVTSFSWGRLDGTPDSDYGDVAGFTRVSQFTSWIDSILHPNTGGGAKGGHGRPKKGAELAALLPEPPDVHIVPEPASLSLLGVMGLMLMGRRRRA